MLSMVAVAPQPPLLVPELTAGAAPQVAQLRAACLDVAGRLAQASRRWIAVGSHPDSPTGPPAEAGTFRGFGVDVPVVLTPKAAQEQPDAAMPLPLLIAGWLREQVAPTVEVRGVLVPPDLPTSECVELGAQLAAELAADPEPIGLLVLGDGATTHTARAPGGLDARSGPFDEQAAAALAAADTDALLALDPDLAAELGAVGRAPWQVLAAAADGGWRGELVYSAAPYGVAYHVAVWTRAAS